jgi:hypothetical protein
LLHAHLTQGPVRDPASDAGTFTHIQQDQSASASFHITYRHYLPLNATSTITSHPSFDRAGVLYCRWRHMATSITKSHQQGPNRRDQISTYTHNRRRHVERTVAQRRRQRRNRAVPCHCAARECRPSVGSSKKPIDEHPEPKPQVYKQRQSRCGANPPSL